MVKHKKNGNFVIDLPVLNKILNLDANNYRQAAFVGWNNLVKAGVTDSPFSVIDRENKIIYDYKSADQFEEEMVS